MKNTSIGKIWEKLEKLEKVYLGNCDKIGETNKEAYFSRLTAH
jgi:hypothetical protein